MTSKSTLWRRTLWHLTRTPLCGPIKSLQRLRVRDDIRHRREIAQGLPVSPAQRRMADELNHDGYTFVTEVVDPALLTALEAAADAKYQRGKAHDVAQQKTPKDFWTRLLDEDMQDGALPADNVFVRFALQPAILSVLARAYGELPQLDYVLLLLSQGNGNELTQSQLWHRDHDDIRTIKLYVYFTDVSEQDDGPFTFLPGPVSDRMRFSLRSHRADEDIESRVRSGEVKSMTAPRLSVFMVETSRCLHMGSRVALGHERMMYMATFISVPRMFPEPAARFKLTGAESEVVRRVLSPATQGA